MQKICFLTISPFSKWDYKRFAIEEFKDLGFEVLVLDCTPFLDVPFEKYLTGEKICFKNEKIRRCNSLIQFLKYFLQFNPTWTIDFISFQRDKYFYSLLIRIFVKLISKIIYYRTGGHPYVTNSQIYKDKRFPSFWKIKFLLRRLITLPWLIMGPDKWFLGGYSEFIKVKDKKKIIFGHNLDYDSFLKITRKSNLKNKRLKNILFLDEDFPCHSDFFRSGIIPELNESEYFSEISLCLKKLGKILKLKPIVKLHPRSNIKKSTELYTVDVVHKDTAKLVYESDLVIAHCSTSIQLAVLFYKPIILIIPNKLPNKSYYFKNIENFKNELGVESIRSKDVYNIKDIPKIDYRKYDQYKEKFIKMKCSENNFSWEIIVKQL